MQERQSGSHSQRDTCAESGPGALSQKDIKRSLSHLHLFNRACSVWLRLRDLKEAGDWGRCRSDGGGGGVGLAGCAPGDGTGITEPGV